MSEPDKQRLVEQIQRAWADVQYPGDGNIFTPDSYDDEGITEYFSGTTWKGHSVENLRAHETALSTFFMPAAYHYWLPAYLLAAVEDPDELSQGVDSLVRSFVPRDASSLFKQEQQERLRLLSNEQKMAVIGVLEYLAWKYGAEEDMARALKHLYETTATA